MEEHKPILVDTNYFVALFNTADTLHTRAKKIAYRLEHTHTPLIITNFIFLEVVTILAQRVGKRTALSVGNFLLRNPLVRWVHIDEPLQKITWTIFCSLENKNISFVDCNTLAVLQHENSRRLLSFESHDFAVLQKAYRFTLLAE